MLDARMGSFFAGNVPVLFKSSEFKTKLVTSSFEFSLQAALSHKLKLELKTKRVYNGHCLSMNSTWILGTPSAPVVRD